MCPAQAMSTLFDRKCVTIFDRINKKCGMLYKVGTHHSPEIAQITDSEGSMVGGGGVQWGCEKTACIAL